MKSGRISRKMREKILRALIPHRNFGFSPVGAFYFISSPIHFHLFPDSPFIPFFYFPLLSSSLSVALPSPRLLPSNQPTYLPPPCEEKSSSFGNFKASWLKFGVGLPYMWFATIWMWRFCGLHLHKYCLAPMTCIQSDPTEIIMSLSNLA